MRLCTPRTIHDLRDLLDRYGLTLHVVASGEKIPGSYWLEPEAGLVGTTVYVRPDTPLHSALHESCHAICMDPARRSQLHTDAGGEYVEEDAVCYLQIVLAGEMGVPHLRLCADMDEWGYTFRLGSAQSWFERDADDARTWLIRHRLLTSDQKPTWQLRSA